MSECPIPAQRYDEPDMFTTAKSITEARGLDPLADNLGSLAAQLEHKANGYVAEARRANLSSEVLSRMEEHRRLHFQRMEELKYPDSLTDCTRSDDDL